MDASKEIELKLSFGVVQQVMSSLAMANQVRVALGLPQDLGNMRALVEIAGQLPKSEPPVPTLAEVPPNK